MAFKAFEASSCSNKINSFAFFLASASLVKLSKNSCSLFFAAANAFSAAAFSSAAFLSAADFAEACCCNV